jgi:periplasmic nitrate reductase NapE
VRKSVAHFPISKSTRCDVARTPICDAANHLAALYLIQINGGIWGPLNLNLRGGARQYTTQARLTARSVPAQVLLDPESYRFFMLGRTDKRDAQSASAHGTARRDELIVFAIIAAFIWPVIAVGVVGGYGFLVWMSQLILGPPGPPGA